MQESGRSLKRGTRQENIFLLRAYCFTRTYDFLIDFPAFHISEVILALTPDKDCASGSGIRSLHNTSKDVYYKGHSVSRITEEMMYSDTTSETVMRDLMTLYHGSTVIVETPQYGKGKRTNDYGQGFYCTENPELAKEWACPGRANGFCNSYQLNIQQLNVVQLNGPGFTILHWLALLLENRKVSLQTPLERAAANYILQHFHRDYSSADVLIGYRADDRYFSFVRAFLSNQITVQQLAIAMHLGKLGEQVFLKSEKAFSAVTFQAAAPVDWNIYLPKRERRAEQAASDYQMILKQTGVMGIYMADVLRGQVPLEQLEKAAETALLSS